MVMDSIICSNFDPPREISPILFDIYNLLPCFSVANYKFYYKSSKEIAHLLADWVSFSSSWRTLPISSIPWWGFFFLRILISRLSHCCLCPLWALGLPFLNKSLYIYIYIYIYKVMYCDLIKSSIFCKQFPVALYY